MIFRGPNNSSKSTFVSSAPLPKRNRVTSRFPRSICSAILDLPQQHPPLSTPPIPTSSLSRRAFLHISTAFAIHPLVLSNSASSAAVTSAYDIVASKDGNPFPLREFSGKLTLFVNVATYCALTPQYEGLVSLHDTFQPRGFEIIASPCDQFGHQEPGSNQEICAFAKEKFGARFLLLDKLNVNDAPGGVAPLYQFLRSTSPEGTGQRISWNFEKFLVAPDGHVLRRYKPGILPEDLQPNIQWALDHPGKDLPPKKKPSLGVA